MSHFEQFSLRVNPCLLTTRFTLHITNTRHCAHGAYLQQCYQNK
uniref:Uncharacterized protein n=1 Tax=Anguilla anguilla TaxID=7936 RepID=A0A0E9Q3B0_ANGAN